MGQQPDFATAHYDQRTALTQAAAAAASQQWQQVNPDKIADSWAAQVPETAVIVSGAQYAAAALADPYLDEASAFAELSGGAAEPAGTVAPRAFAGIASDGRNLFSLLFQPAVSALMALANRASVPTAMASGKSTLDMIVRTQVADAGRAADQVALTSRRELDGYVRVAVGATCNRCIILAGKHYRWNTGFDRHPNCDCIHLPVRRAAAAGIVQDPVKIYRSLTAAERSAAGWTYADQAALNEGADIFQVTDARRGLYIAGGRKYTSEGVTRRGLYGGYDIDPDTGALTKRPRGARAKPPRLTTDQIFAEAADRDEAIRLLRENGYVTTKPVPAPVIARSLPSLAGEGATGAAARAEVQIRQVLTEAKTSTEVAAAARAEARAITGRKDVTFNFQGADVQTAREHAEGLLRGLERFPDTRLQVWHHSDPGFFSAYAETRGWVINFNTAYARTAGRENYLRSLANDVKTGFHPGGTSSPISTALHEFGHAASFGLKIEPDVQALVIRRAAEAGISETELIGQVSEYATHNLHELVAEAFTDVMLNAERASQLSRDIFDIFVREYEAGGRRYVGLPSVIARSMPAPADLSRLKLTELKALAKERGLTGYSKLTKPQLLERLGGEAKPAVKPVKVAAPKPAVTMRPIEHVPAGARIEQVDPARFEKVRVAAKKNQGALDAAPVQALYGDAKYNTKITGLRSPTPLPISVQRAVSRYMGSPASMNNLMRLRPKDLARYAKDAEELARMTRTGTGYIRDLDRAMSASPLSSDVLVYRGIPRERARVLTRLLDDVGRGQGVRGFTGLTWTDGGFISTSASREYARAAFAESAVPGREPPILMRIVVPKGTGALRISDSEVGLKESELLLDRGLTFRVVADNGVTDRGYGARLLDVEIVPARTGAEVADLSKLKVTELRALAKERGISGYGKLTKPQLAERLGGSEAKTAVVNPKVVRTRPSYLDAENSLLLEGYADSVGIDLRRYVDPLRRQMVAFGEPLEEQRPFGHQLGVIIDGLKSGKVNLPSAIEQLRQVPRAVEKELRFARQAVRGGYASNRDLAVIRDAELAKVAPRLADALEGLKLPRRVRRPTLGALTRAEIPQIDESRFAVAGEGRGLLGGGPSPKGGLVLHRGQVVPESFEHPRSGFMLLQDASAPLRPGLTAEENHALDLYVSSAVADPLNGALRLGLEPPTVDLTLLGENAATDLREIQRLLDRAIGDSELSRDTTLWRGALMRPADLQALTPGAIITESAYMSTAADQRLARNIIQWRKRNAPAYQKPVLFRILTRQGTHAAVGHEAAGEVLFGRGTRIQVLRSETEKWSGTTIITVLML